MIFSYASDVNSYSFGNSGSHNVSELLKKSDPLYGQMLLINQISIKTNLFLAGTDKTVSVLRFKNVTKLQLIGSMENMQEG